MEVKKEQVSHLPGVVEDELVVGGEGGVHVRRGPPRRRVVRPGRAGKTVAAGQLQLCRHYDYKFINFSITTPWTCLGFGPHGDRYQTATCEHFQ